MVTQGVVRHAAETLAERGTRSSTRGGQEPF